MHHESTTTTSLPAFFIFEERSLDLVAPPCHSRSRPAERQDHTRVTHTSASHASAPPRFALRQAPPPAFDSPQISHPKTKQDGRRRSRYPDVLRRRDLRGAARSGFVRPASFCHPHALIVSTDTASGTPTTCPLTSFHPPTHAQTNNSKSETIKNMIEGTSVRWSSLRAVFRASVPLVVKTVFTPRALTVPPPVPPFQHRHRHGLRHSPAQRPL